MSDIDRDALQAAVKAAYAQYDGSILHDEGDEPTGYCADQWNSILTAAIRAYEAALWKPIETHPQNGFRGERFIVRLKDGKYLCECYGTSDDVWWPGGLIPQSVMDCATHWRPLPQPPGDAE